MRNGWGLPAALVLGIILEFAFLKLRVSRCLSLFNAPYLGEIPVKAARAFIRATYILAD